MYQNKSLSIPRNAVAHLGGHASRQELIALRCSPDHIDMSLWYRHILPTRKGWYASKETEPSVLRALRVGGRLACVSALAWYSREEIPTDRPVHVLVRYGASRLRTEGAIIHWTRRHVAGNRLMVDEETALVQAASCRALGRR